MEGTDTDLACDEDVLDAGACVRHVGARRPGWVRLFVDHALDELVDVHLVS